MAWTGRRSGASSWPGAWRLRLSLVDFVRIGRNKTEWLNAFPRFPKFLNQCAQFCVGRRDRDTHNNPNRKMKTIIEIKSRVIRLFKSFFTRSAEASEGRERITTYQDRIVEGFLSMGYRPGDDLPSGMEQEVENEACAGRFW